VEAAAMAAVAAASLDPLFLCFMSGVGLWAGAGSSAPALSERDREDSCAFPSRHGPSQ
jgi:hypothetical protein